MQFYEIFIRLLLATIFAAIIGMDREFKNRPAGISTHILVCLGATLVALIQVEIMYQSMDIAILNPELGTVIRSDPARLICQVISGIGFLGAGTIIVTKRSVVGLTTAASLWAIAAIGVALGMGYYVVAIISFIFVFIALKFVKKIVHLPATMQLEVQYSALEETKKYILDYFSEFQVVLKEVEFKIDSSNTEPICTNTFLLEATKDIVCEDLVSNLSQHETIKKVRLFHLN